MTPADFEAWLAAMKSAGRIRFAMDACDLLGVHQNTVTTYRRKGAPVSIALACAALLKGLKPYQASQ